MMEPFALGAAVLLAASLMGMGGGAMYPKLVKGAGSVQSAEGRTAGKERDKKRKELERAANAPQSKLLGFFKRSQYYDPEQGVHRPPPDPEVEAQRRQAAAWVRWRSWKRWLLDRLKSSGGRPPNPRQLVSSICAARRCPRQPPPSSPRRLAPLLGSLQFGASDSV